MNVRGIALALGLGVLTMAGCKGNPTIEKAQAEISKKLSGSDYRNISAKLGNNVDSWEKASLAVADQEFAFDKCIEARIACHTTLNKKFNPDGDLFVEELLGTAQKIGEKTAKPENCHGAIRRVTDMFSDVISKSKPALLNRARDAAGAVCEDALKSCKTNAHEVFLRTLHRL